VPQRDGDQDPQRGSGVQHHLLSSAMNSEQFNRQHQRTTPAAAQTQWLAAGSRGCASGKRFNRQGPVDGQLLRD
jgi:hypothetical protein